MDESLGIKKFSGGSYPKCSGGMKMKRSRLSRKTIVSLFMSVAMAVTVFLPMAQETAYAAHNNSVSDNSAVHVYADTPGDVESSKYTLKANGYDVPVIKYSANGNNFDVARFASDDTTPEYTVTVANETINTVKVYPERYYNADSLVVSEDKHSVTFTMSENLRYAYVMINGGPADQAGKPYLAIINDPMETDKPDVEASNVLNAKEFMEAYLLENPNSDAQKAEAAGTTSGGTVYEAGELVENETAQVRFPDKRLMAEDDVTYALQAALDEIYKENSPYDTLYFPAGTYVWSGLEIRDRKGKDVTIYVEEGALLKNRIQECMQAMEPAIGIWDSEDITISGRGMFDGNGVANYKKDRHDAKDSCHQGGVMIVRSSNITFNDTYVRDAKQWNWESHGSKNCTLNNIKGLTPYNQPWVDGLDMASAQNLKINGAITLGNDDNFASGHYNPSDGFPNTVPGYDQYNSDCLTWDTEDSYNVSVKNTLGWSYGGGNGVRMGHNTYGHKMLNYTFENVNTTNFTGGGNGITVQNGKGNGHPYPYYENITFKNCSFDTTRVGTNFNINGLDTENKIGEVTLQNCWFSNGANGSYVNCVDELNISDLYVGGAVEFSSQALLTTTEVTTENVDWIINEIPVFISPSKDAFTVKSEETLAFTVSATDLDGTEEEKVVLSVKAETLPKGASFEASTGAFSWMPTEEQVGSHAVTFVASDIYESREKVVQIEVTSSKYDTKKVAVSQDATIKAWKTEKTGNYGTQDYIRTMRMSDALAENSTVGIFGEKVGDSTSDARDAKISLLTFDSDYLIGYQENLQKAELVLTYIGRRESGITGDDKLMAAVATDSFKEDSVTWNVMPEIDATNIKSSGSFAVDKNGVVMAQDEKYGNTQAIDGTKVAIDITDFVKNLDGDAEAFTLAVCDENGWELAFVSKEGAKSMANATSDMAPVIQLTVNAGAQSTVTPDTGVNAFTPNTQWLDNNETMIQAHGGGVIWDEETEKYYWYGENKGESNTSTGGIVAIGVSCYSSPDLYNWTYEGMALPVFNNPAFLTAGEATKDTPLYLAESSEEYQTAKAAGKAVSEYDTLEKYNTAEEIEAFNALYADATAEEKQALYNKLNWNCVVERPKVIYNKKNDNYVMWFHKDGEGIGTYNLAETGIAVSDSPTGPFKLVDSIRPNGAESRDMTLFKDTDGTAYLLHSSEDNWTLYIAELNADYTGLTGKFSRNYVDKGGSKGVYAREAPAIFKEDGNYYIISSGCTGWRPNEMGYSVADNIREGLSEEGGNGPFQMSNLKNPCVGTDAETSFGGQSTYVIPVQGMDGCFIYMGDKWNSTNLKDSRYQWLPIQVDSEEKTLTISWSDEWSLDDFELLNSDERIMLNRATREAGALSATEYNFGQTRWETLQTLILEAQNLPYQTSKEELKLKSEALSKAVQEVKRWSVLDAAIAEVENRAEAVYSKESWNNVKAAYEAAVALSENATEAEIKEAAKAINDAIELLVTIEVETEKLDLTGKDVVTDSYQSGNEVSKAIDGNTTTFWHCKYGTGATELPHHVTIDLGESYENLYQLNYLPRQDKDFNGIATRYKIYVSNADKALDQLTDADFTMVRTGTWEEDKALKSSVFRTEGAVRFVRLEIVEGVGGFASAAEIELLLGTVVDNGNQPSDTPATPETPGGDTPNDPTTPEVPGGDKPTTPGGSQTPGQGSTDKAVSVEKLSVKADSTKIAAGKKVQLSVSVAPANATNQSVTWQSSNKKYAEVTAKGVVKTKKVGKGKTVIITAVANDGSGVKASVKIKIMKHAVTKVSLKNAPKTLKAGKKATLKVVVKTNGKNVNKKIKWTSSNPEYATVNSKGKVTAKKAGKGKTVTITAISTDGTNKKAKIKIRIK